jgi:bifunctional UDP-N-acetylglucosamine pyrophosphorylase/glucosamine-1-phosphate N-acetyltransferase
MQPAATAAIILAAGLGSRMRSDRPKVLHPVAGRTMIAHVVAALEGLGLERVIAVIGPEAPPDAFPALCQTVVQTDRRGTGDAARTAFPLLEGFAGTVLILAGDVPLIMPDSLRRLIDRRAAEPVCGIALGGFKTAAPSGYGRIIRDAAGSVLRIVEERDASEAERGVQWCNSGIMAIDASRLSNWLGRLTTDNVQGEYYLTDIIRLAVEDGAEVALVEVDEEEVLGVNSRADLARVEQIAQNHLRREALKDGATLIDPATVYFSFDTKLGRDVTIGPSVVFGPGVSVGDGSEIKAFSHIEGAVIGKDTVIGPFARLRPGTRISDRAHIGNFVEIKNALIGEDAKAGHLSYLGDATVGAGSNIGAGTITCNYDGFTKARTEIGPGVFIGSHTALVAPVTIGSDAMIGAGSVITQDVPADALALSRAELKIREGGAARFRRGKSAKKTEA